MKKELIYFEKIEAYHNGTSSAKAKASFETELSSNPALKKEYDAYLASQKVLQALGMDMLENHPIPIDASSNRKRIFSFWRVAAALLLLGGGLLWYANQFYSNTVLASYQAPKSQVLRGNIEASSSAINQAVKSFEKGDYQGVISVFGEEGNQDPFYNESQFLLGHTYYQLKDYEKSVAAFQNVVASTDTRFTENAFWNTANIYILQGDKKQALTMLESIANDSNNAYQKNAKLVLQKVNSNWRYFTFL